MNVWILLALLAVCLPCVVASDESGETQAEHSAVGIVDVGILERRWANVAGEVAKLCSNPACPQHRELYELVRAVDPRLIVIAATEDDSARRAHVEVATVTCGLRIAARALGAALIRVPSFDAYFARRASDVRVDLLVLATAHLSAEETEHELRAWFASEFSNASGAVLWDPSRSGAVVLLGTHMHPPRPDDPGGGLAAADFAIRATGVAFNPAEPLDAWYLGCPNSPACAGAGDGMAWAGGGDQGAGEEEWRLIHEPALGGAPCSVRLHPKDAAKWPGTCLHRS